MKRILKNIITYIGLGLVLLVISPDAKAEVPMSVANAYQFEFKAIDGGDIHLSDFEGKAVLLVNTASQCGLTGQYKELQTLHETYKDQGLVVLGVPSGDFAGQEFSQESEVKTFTEDNYNVSFPLTKISKVKGEEAHPFYNWANSHADILGGPKWNFHKYLIDKKGNLVKGYKSLTSPTSPEIIQDIEAELKK